MCNFCTNSTKLNMLSQIDPTGTTGLRNRFAAQMRKRFDAIARDITQAVDRDDCFGLKRRDDINIFAAASPGKRAFEFKNDDEKVKLFMDWLKQQVDSKVLEITQGEAIGGKPWSNLYVQSAYQKGISDARNNLIKEGLDIPKFDGITETGQYLGAAFNKDFHVNRLGLLYTRTFNDLKGITNNMDSQISRVLAQGIADGRNPRDLARQMRAVVTGDLAITDKIGRYIPAKRRAEMLARTEVIRAHVQAKLMEFKQAEIDGVIIKAELLITGDGRTCPECKDLEGKTYTLNDESEIWNIIPVHPLCRCTVVPMISIPKVKEKIVEEKIEEPTWENAKNPKDAIDRYIKSKSTTKLNVIEKDLNSIREKFFKGKDGNIDHAAFVQTILDHGKNNPEVFSRATKLAQILKDNGGLTQETFERLRQGLCLLSPEKLDKLIPSEIILNGDHKGRAYFKPSNKTIFFSKSKVGDSSVESIGKDRFLFHEFGHHIEIETGVIKKSEAWLKWKNNNAGIRTLRDITGNPLYNVSEKAYLDKFVSPYVGKINAYGTEVYSMGFQCCCNARDLSILAQKDFSHFSFLVATMKGFV